MRIPAPLLAGFHPDPSIVEVDGAYYLLTSTFEYLPGLPVHRSTDLVEWELVGHVITRAEQAGLEHVPTPGGVWAPTIRHRDGVFHVIVTVMLGGRGCVVFTATDPAGPWSDGVSIPAVTGIDPDLAWDDETGADTAYVTFAQYPRGIRQVRVDLDTGEAAEEPRALWSGSGLYAPEGPHLHRRDGWWYLLAAEGGTDRGHAVTIARSRSPEGPFESCPDNPILTTRSTGLPVQSVGHADLLALPGGGEALVHLGVRPVGLAKGFSPLGRESFLSSLEWADDGWPHGTALTEAPGADPEELVVDLSRPLGGRWVAVRRTPGEVVTQDGDGLRISSDGAGITDLRPWFVGVRQRHLGGRFSASVDDASGVGGVALRLSEDHVLAVEASFSHGRRTVTGRAVLAGLEHRWESEVASGALRLGLDLRPASSDFLDGETGADTITLWAEVDGERTDLASVDGRYWTYETAKCFTGRVLGVYAESGSVQFADATYTGDDDWSVPTPNR